MFSHIEMRLLFFSKDDRIVNLGFLSKSFTQEIVYLLFELVSKMLGFSIDENNLQALQLIQKSCLNCDDLVNFVTDVFRCLISLGFFSQLEHFTCRSKFIQMAFERSKCDMIHQKNQ